MIDSSGEGCYPEPDRPAASGSESLLTFELKAAPSWWEETGKDPTAPADYEHIADLFEVVEDASGTNA